jgi:hypothetical protein
VSFLLTFGALSEEVEKDLIIKDQVVFRIGEEIVLHSEMNFFIQDLQLLKTCLKNNSFILHATNFSQKGQLAALPVSKTGKGSKKGVIYKLLEIKKLINYVTGQLKGQKAAQTNYLTACKNTVWIKNLGPQQKANLKEILAVEFFLRLRFDIKTQQKNFKSGQLSGAKVFLENLNQKIPHELYL